MVTPLSAHDPKQPCRGGRWVLSTTVYSLYKHNCTLQLNRMEWARLHSSPRDGDPGARPVPVPGTPALGRTHSQGAGRGEGTAHAEGAPAELAGKLWGPGRGFNLLRLARLCTWGQPSQLQQAFQNLPRRQPYQPSCQAYPMPLHQLIGGIRTGAGRPPDGRRCHYPKPTWYPCGLPSPRANRG